MKFEWDTDKDEQNQAKHGISFAEASEMIRGYETLQIPAREVSGERRDIVLGLIKGKCCAAVITVREGTIRIISCRRARDNERALYEQG